MPYGSPIGIRDLQYQKSSNTVEILRKLLEDDPTDGPLGTAVYSFFFRDADSENSQIDVSQQLRTIRDNLEHDLELFEEGQETEHLKVLPQGIVAKITTSAHAHFLPTNLAATTSQKDIDSGNCDILNNTTFTLGTNVVIKAQFKDFLFVQSVKQYGWIHLSNIALEDWAHPTKGLTELFYWGSQPLKTDSGVIFYWGSQPLKTDSGVIFPGDSGIYRSADGSLQRAVRSPQGILRLQSLENVNQDDFIDKIRTPQQLLDRLYNLRVTYQKGRSDCSAILSRALNTIGIDVPRYSGDLHEYLELISDEQEITQPSDLETLRDGIYVTALNTRKKNGEYVTTHLYLTTIAKGRWEAFSYAFNLNKADGRNEYCVGPDVSTRDDLQLQLQKNINDDGINYKTLSFIQIAA